MSDNSLLSHLAAMTRPRWFRQRRGTGIATPSSRRRVEWRERTVTFDSTQARSAKP